MHEQLRGEVLTRLHRDYGLTHIAGTNYLRKGTCPVCSKRELYSFFDKPWMLHCGRLSKCGSQIHVKDVYADLFNDWSERAPATDTNPMATARAYLEFARGFRLELVNGLFTQEQFWSRELNEGSATVRFPLPNGGYWERLIDRPERFGKQKARFKPGAAYKGQWWCAPQVDLAAANELWIVEGIFDALALQHNGLTAVAAMSSGNYPDESLKQLLKDRSSTGARLPRLIWALDNEPSGHRFTRKFVKAARELGFTCEAAQIPQRDGRKVDWNDLHQRWVFIEDASKQADRVAADLKEARHHGALLIAESAGEKALIMYEWQKRAEFHFGFNSRLYWFKLDLEKFNKAMTALEDSDDHADQQLNDRQMREKALQESGCTVEIANCYPEALYYQRNEVTDESWYYLRVDFPHDAASVKNTFTSTQLAASSEFKKRLLGMAAGAMFTGTGQQLDKIMKDQLYGIKTVSTIDYVGYSKEYSSYVFGDVAVRDGQVFAVNEEDYFEFGKLRIKSLQKGVRINLQQDGKSYNEQWLKLLWTCFAEQGIVALVFWFGSLFAEQIRAKYQSFPFLEATGEAGAGKTTLLNVLWKLLGRDGYEGFDPMKSTKAGRSRLMGQVSAMPVVFLEADRHGDDKSHAKTFEWDELKDFFGGGTLATKGVKTAGNETYEPPFRGTIAISQNAPVIAHEAIMTRICKLHFKRPEVTPTSRAAAARLNMLDGDTLSHFLLLAVKQEAKVLEVFEQRFPEHEQRLRTLNSNCINCGTEYSAEREQGACNKCGNTLRGYIRVERIIKNHAQLLALLDALRLVVGLTDAQVSSTQRKIIAMALERQASISADHPQVAEFWEVFDYLEGLDADGPVVNHSKKDELIAINLNEFCERAAEHRQKLADVGVLRDLLKESRSRKFVDANRAVDSAVRSYQAAKHNHTINKSPTVKCWMFKAQ
ncbi:toprim domain-containing protein [Pseudomonas marincola]|uniref:toprim domain-containing protein n=1 Tax=Pseudomonas marincola TaxID=437900 RepID=UPI0008ED6591|nr:toprim domain-containing protein [Pseudomonas marincola]SFT49524.1 Toprim-like [Pseudomonas marincola]